MRDMVTVIDRIVEVVPSNETYFLAALKSLRSSVLYAAPEMKQLWWNEFNEVFNDHINVPREELNEWQMTVVDIFMAKI